MKKRRSRITTYSQEVPLCQYRFNEYTEAWMDAPYFVTTLHELRAFLYGKGIHNVIARVITAYKETIYVL